MCMCAHACVNLGLPGGDQAGLLRGEVPSLVMALTLFMFIVFVVFKGLFFLELVMNSYWGCMRSFKPCVLNRPGDNNNYYA